MNFGMLYAFLSALFYLTRSSPPSVGFLDQLYVHHYRLVSDPSQCLEVHTAYSITPLILRVYLEYELHYEEQTMQPLTMISERYYFKTQTECQSNYLISNMNLKFKHINLQISIYTTTESKSQIAKLDITFKSDIQEGMLELFDTFSNFALNIGFFHDGKEYIPPSVDDRDNVAEGLKSVNDPGTRICVVTPNSVVIEFQPEFPPGSKPKGTITNILYRYISNTGITKWQSHIAWDCSESQSDATVGIFVRDEHDSGILETILLCFDYAKDTNFVRPFRIPYNKIVKFQDSHGSSEFLMVYLMNNKPDIIVCPTNGESMYIKLRKKLFTELRNLYKLLKMDS